MSCVLGHTSFTLCPNCPESTHSKKSGAHEWEFTSLGFDCFFLVFFFLGGGGCFTSLQYAIVSQGRVCSDKYTSCHTEIEVKDQTERQTDGQRERERERLID